MKSNPQSLAIRPGELRPALVALAKVVRKNASKKVLQCVKVETVGRNHIRLTGTDSTTFLTTELTTSNPFESEPFLIPLFELQDQLRSAKGNNEIQLRKTQNSEPVSGFPATPVFRAKSTELSVSATTALRQAMACSSNDASRVAIQSVFIDADRKDQIRFIGTDGRHLFQSERLEGFRIPNSAVLPALPVWKCKLMRDSKSLVFRSSLTKKPAGEYQIEGTNWTLTGEFIDGKYPNYQQVIPPASGFKTTLTIPESELREIDRSIRKMPGSNLLNRPIGLQIKSNTLSVLARKSNDSEFKQESFQATVEGRPDVTVFLNRDYFSKALQFGMNQIEIQDDSSPVKFTGRAGLMIVMPIRKPQEFEKSESRPPVIENPQPRKKIMKTGSKPNSRPAPMDQLDSAESRIREIKEALKTAADGLTNLTALVKVARQQKRQTDREIKSVRNGIKSLRNVKLGE